MTTKDRVLGWAGMALWALMAYAPLTAVVLMIQINVLAGLDHYTTTIILAMLQVVSLLWMFTCIRAGIELCTKRPAITNSGTNCPNCGQKMLFLNAIPRKVNGKYDLDSDPVGETYGCAPCGITITLACPDKTAPRSVERSEFERRIWKGK